MSGAQSTGWYGPGSEALHLAEQERHALALELHDGLVQDVTGARMQLEGLLATGSLLEGPAREVVRKSVDLLRKAAEEARRLIHGLMPPLLEEKGLVGAIQQLIADPAFEGPSIALVADVAVGRLDPQLEIAVYRIVQQAVANVRRHSKSDRAEVRLKQIGDRLELVVKDWGRGFDPAHIPGNRYGLMGIRERARLLGGWAEVDSAPGQGTRITVSLPLAAHSGGNVTHE